MVQLPALRQFITQITQKFGVRQKVVLGVIILYLLNKLRKYLGFVSLKSLNNEIIFITGAASGIGRQIAFRVARLGAKVVIADINYSEAQRVANGIKHEKKQALAVQCDVTDYGSIQAAVQQVRDEFGPPTILINNAGVVTGKKIHESTPEMMDKVVKVNMTSNLYTIKEMLPDMIKANKGHIVTVASAAGLSGQPGLVDYCASKYGQVGLNEALRREMKMLRKRVYTTVVCPYYINTGMFKGVGNNSSWLASMLDEHYVANQIIQAIRTNQEELLLPRSVHLNSILKGIFPSWFNDKIYSFLGFDREMESFQGRERQVY